MMFTLFNSKSLWIGTDLKRFSQIREALAIENIAYRAKSRNHLGQSVVMGSMRGHAGSFGNSPSRMYQYEVIVYSKDFEKAKYLINR